MHRLAVSDRESPHHYSKISLAANDHERALMQKKPYLAALATVMFTAFWTLPHIVFHCSYLGQFMHDPSPLALQAVFELIIYIYMNRDVDIIMYTKGTFSMPRQIPEPRRATFESNFGVHGYCDASWLLRSVGGHIVMMCNGPVDWSSKLIKIVPDSSCEAETALGSRAAKATCFVRGLLQFHKRPVRASIPSLCDNKAMYTLKRRALVLSTNHAACLPS